MRLAIIGSRDCGQIDIASHIETRPDVIVSGGARGIDTLARQYAKVRGIELIEFLPDYESYGRRAPLVRDREIVDDCDSVLAFWDGKSRGTKYTMDYARRRGKPVRVIPI